MESKGQDVIAVPETQEDEEPGMYEEDSKGSEL